MGYGRRKQTPRHARAYQTCRVLVDAMTVWGRAGLEWGGDAKASLLHRLGKSKTGRRWHVERRGSLTRRIRSWRVERGRMRRVCSWHVERRGGMRRVHSWHVERRGRVRRVCS